MTTLTRATTATGMRATGMTMRATGTTTTGMTMRATGTTTTGMTMRAILRAMRMVIMPTLEE